MSLSQRRLLMLLAAFPLGLAVPVLADELAAPMVSLPAAASATDAALALPAAATTVDATDGVLRINGAARATASRTSAYGVDPNGARSSDALQGSSRATLQIDFDTGRRLGDWGAQAALAFDAVSGTYAGAPTLEGDKIPGARFEPFLPTQAWAGLSLRDLGTLRVGLMNSHWGLGLLANDGNHALDSRRDDWFVLPTTGDRVARAQLVMQPFGRTSTAARGLFVAFSVDQVIEDATAIRAQGDTAVQEVAAVRWHFAKERWAGVYYVHRDQTFHNTSGPFLKVDVLDAAFDMDYRKVGSGLRVQGEGAVILGRTDLAPTPDHPEHDVRQSAAVAKARYDWADKGLRFELDGGWFSGDDNLEDGALTGFKANPNFQQGILLFSQVLGWQSGRSRVTASNPQVSGYPSADLDRLATGGAVTSAITAFPKVGWKATSFLEIYGGALLAFSPTAPIDAFSTRIGGGTPRNYLGKAPNGSLLGTEFDLGAVATLTSNAWPFTLALRGEYAILLPGGVQTGMDADSPVHGGRLSLSIARTPAAVKEAK